MTKALTITQAVEQLKALGDANTAKIYARHGVTSPSVGLPYAALGKLVKTIGQNHALATRLYERDLHDARVLATKIADAEKVDEKLLNAWLEKVDNYILSDALASLLARTPIAMAVIRKWRRKKGEWPKATAYSALSILATSLELSDKDAGDTLTLIEKGIATAENRARHSMNNALIAIGGTMEALRPEAIRIATAMGRIEVDHGQTGCKTPEAVPYIERMVAHQMKKRSRVTGAKTRARRTP